MNHRQCSECMYWRAREATRGDAPGSRTGQCCRRSPLENKQTTDDNFPITNDVQLCGDFAVGEFGSFAKKCAPREPIESLKLSTRATNVLATCKASRRSFIYRLL